MASSAPMSFWAAPSGSIVIESGLEAVVMPSFTCTVKLQVPEVVGVPEIAGGPMGRESCYLIVHASLYHICLYH